GVAFVTGGARGLGNLVAVSFAKEGSRRIVIVDIQGENDMIEGKRKVEEQGAECLTIRVNVTKEEDVERAVAIAVAKFSRIDYAANFAGVAGPHENICEINISSWEKTRSVNSTSVLISTKHEEPGRQPQQGSIINCASVNSLQSMAGTASYTASKHAVHGITKAAALEARQHNIRVNAVSPRFLLTNLAKTGVKEGGAVGSALWGYFEARQGRPAQFEEIGDAVVLMSMPWMSLVNGHNLFIDGGFTINESNF
ncbi:NAD(P)-binding protein, partial [Glonium stellatum]